MKEISSFLRYVGFSNFGANQAKPSFFAKYGELSQAELFCPKARAKTKPNRAELWLEPNTNN